MATTKGKKQSFVNFCLEKAGKSPGDLTTKEYQELSRQYWNHSTTDDSVSAPTDGVGDWKERLYNRFPGIDRTWNGGVSAFIASELENARTQDRAELVRKVEGMNEQNELTQAILGALEYRGFHDGGKYLDPDIWERVKPVVLSLLSKTD